MLHGMGGDGSAANNPVYDTCIVCFAHSTYDGLLHVNRILSVPLILHVRLSLSVPFMLIVTHFICVPCMLRVLLLSHVPLMLIVTHLICMSCIMYAAHATYLACSP